MQCTNNIYYHLHLQYHATISQERQVETWADKSSLHGAAQSGITAEYVPSSRKESLFLERESQLESRYSRYSGISLYGHDPALSTIRSSGLSRASGPIVTQVGVFSCSLYIIEYKFPE